MPHLFLDILMHNEGLKSDCALQAQVTWSYFCFNWNLWLHLRWLPSSIPCSIWVHGPWLMSFFLMRSLASVQSSNTLVPSSPPGCTHFERHCSKSLLHSQHNVKRSSPRMQSLLHGVTFFFFYFATSERASFSSQGTSTPTPPVCVFICKHSDAAMCRL